MHHVYRIQDEAGSKRCLCHVLQNRVNNTGYSKAQESTILRKDHRSKVWTAELAAAQTILTSSTDDRTPEEVI
jgi:hypothetical protein